MAEEVYLKRTTLEIAETCHDCGAAMTRGIRPMTINYKGLSATFDMPGWYCVCGEGVVTGKDMKVSDYYLNLLKTQAENLSAV